MKLNIKLLVFLVLLPLLVGGLSSFISGNSADTYTTLVRPTFAPPGWLFPIVWPILFILMGFASYMIATSDAKKEDITNALRLYFIQLAVNFIWPILFFRFDLYFLSFFWLVLLWYLIILTIYSFYQISKPAAYLLIPYILWITFAGYLNLSIAFLN